MTREDLGHWLTAHEAADQLGIAPSAIYPLIYSGRLPANRSMASFWLIAVVDLERYRINEAQRRSKKGEIQKFWSRVKMGDGCWEWQEGVSGVGYGQTRWKGRFVGAHRISWEIHFGAVPN